MMPWTYLGLCHYQMRDVFLDTLAVSFTLCGISMHASAAVVPPQNQMITCMECLMTKHQVDSFAARAYYEAYTLTLAVTV